MCLPGIRLLAAPPSTTGTGWQLVFADDFSGTSVDTVKWNIASPSWTMPNADSAASASEVSASNGILTLSANRPSSTGTFNSGSVSTYGNYTWTGGYFEASILLPTTPGSWPAFWGLYTGWPPEADIMEFPLTTDGGTDGLPSTEYNTDFHYTISGTNYGSAPGPVNPGLGALNTGYHTFGMYWVPGSSVNFYCDGNLVSSFSNSAVSQMPYVYLILDYAVGGWPGTPSTSQWPAGHTDQMQVQWVHVWQQPPGGASTWNINGGGSWTTAGSWSGAEPIYSGQQAAFGTVGNASTASVTWSNSITAGGLSFSGGSTTTAYTLGGTALQLAGSGGTADANIQVLASSQAIQTINSRLEFYNTTDITNNSGYPLILNGVLIGGGGVTVTGTGPVEFDNNNTYNGNTSIGTGQSPGIALVTRSRPFGTAGTVTVGASGNSTTATIQIEGGRSIPNNVYLSGRNNGSAAIENLSGSNTFSGAIALQGGGGNYIMQCDAGLLSLTGTLSLVAGGARISTFQGSGNTTVSALCTDGSGTLSIAQSGAGALTLSNWGNSFSGGISISGTVLASSTTWSNIYDAATGLLGNPMTPGRAITVNSGGSLVFGAGNILGSGGDNVWPAVGIIVNQGGLVQTAAAPAQSPGPGGGDANIFGPITLNGGTFSTGNGFSAAWEAAILTGTVATTGATLSTINTTATNTVANALSLGAANSSGPITFNVGSGGLLVSAPLTNGANGVTGSLLLTGSGTLQLTSSCNYTGTTTVLAGTLALNGAIASSGAMTIAAGAALSGTGTTASGVQISGTHAPGFPVGAQSFTGSLTYLLGSQLLWTLNSSSTAAGASSQVSANIVSAAANTPVDIVLNGAGSGVLFTNNFWSQPHSWTVLTASSVTGPFALGSVSTDSAGNAASSYGAFTVAESATAVTVAYTPYTSEQLWQRANFGTNWNNPAISGDTANPTGNGIPNLMDYALGANPNISSRAVLPRCGISGTTLNLNFTLNTAATDITVNVLGADSPAGPWTTMATSIGGAPFTILAAGATVSEIVTGAILNVQIGDMYPVGTPSHPSRFMELQVQH